jgi:hypothetical protein
MHPSRRTISAGYTLPLKLIAVVWIVGFGLGTFAMLLLASPAPASPILQFFVLWILGSAFLLWSVWPLKRVSIDGDALRVSNYLRVTLIPVHEITGITDKLLLPNLQVVIIWLRSASVFGKKIVFVPSSGSAVRVLRDATAHQTMATASNQV